MDLNADILAIRNEVAKNEKKYLDLLSDGLKASFTNLGDFQNWIGKQMKLIGMEVEEFLVDPSELTGQPAFHKTLKDNPESLQKAPNMVGKLPGKGPRHGMLLYAHADKIPETYEWAKNNPEMTERHNRLYGPGIADDVSGITAMLSAVDTYIQLGMAPKGDVLVASILGKQLGIFGTYGLMKRYGPLDAAIYIHPAESGHGLGELKISSNGMLEFTIEIEGKEPGVAVVETIYSKRGISAAEKGIYIYQGLHHWAAEIARRYPHPPLEEEAGQSFALMFGRFIAGIDNEIKQMPRKCVLEGSVVFPPGVSLGTVQDELTKAFNHLVGLDDWLSDSHARLEWQDRIGESIQVDENSQFIRMATQVINAITEKTPIYHYAHTISDIGYPMLYWNAQAFGVGPLAGELQTENEWVDRKEYLDTIVAVTAMLQSAA